MSLAGKVIVVTGAARGMGRSFAQAYLGAGAKVVAMDRSWEPTGVSNDRDDAFAQELRAREDVLMVNADITDEGAVRRAFEETMSRFGTVDVLVNNAGLRQRDLFPPGRPVALLETTNDDVRRMYEVTIFGTLNMIRAFVQPMLQQRRGSIINIISGGALMKAEGGAYQALRPGSREQPYTSSKAALASLTCYLGDELRDANVAVNGLTPGGTASTGFEEQAAVRGRYRAYQPDHIQPLGLFLADQDAASGNTAKIWLATTWNVEHGHGPDERWLASAS